MMRFISSLYILLCVSISGTFGQEPMKSMLAIDQSLSMSNTNGIIKPKVADLIPVLEYIDHHKGEIALSIIGNNSKEYLVKYRNMCGYIPFPNIDGLNTIKARAAMEAYAIKRKPCSTHLSAKVFLKAPEVKAIFQGGGHNSSDVAGSVELAEIYFSEIDPELKEAKKHAIYVTDGVSNVHTYKAPSSFPYDMTVVYHSKNIGILKTYNPQIATSLKVAIKSILE